MPILLVLLFTAGERDELITRLNALNASDQFLFGVEHGTLWGMFHDGQVVTTSDWFDKTARAGKWTSDSAAITGDDPAVLGISADMLAFEPPEWKRRGIVAEAMRRQLDKGGIVTLDWHAPACGSSKSFYAEDDYKAPITSPKSIPASLTCLCRIANGESSWLTEQAEQLAAVIKEQGMGERALIFRPFHEQNGAWFWWGSPYWNCAALLGKPKAISGPLAYQTLVRLFVSTIKAKIPNALFAYSPADLAIEREHGATDPMSLARDILRSRLLKELSQLGLTYTKKQSYLSSYPGDDLMDVLGIDLYFPSSRAATNKDRTKFEGELRTVAHAARTHGKPFALTEVGTTRFSPPAKTNNDAALALLFDPRDRQTFLKLLKTPASVQNEEWYITQLLPLAKATKVAYAMVWATYVTHDGGSFFVPYPGHHEASSFKRFYEDPATLFLNDRPKE